MPGEAVHPRSCLLLHSSCRTPHPGRRSEKLPLPNLLDAVCAGTAAARRSSPDGCTTSPRIVTRAAPLALPPHLAFMRSPSKAHTHELLTPRMSHVNPVRRRDNSETSLSCWRLSSQEDLCVDGALSVFLAELPSESHAIVRRSTAAIFPMCVLLPSSCWALLSSFFCSPLIIRRSTAGIFPMCVLLPSSCWALLSSFFCSPLIIRRSTAGIFPMYVLLPSSCCDLLSSPLLWCTPS